MQILVQNSTGDITTLDVKPSDTILQLKSMIEANIGTHVDQQMIMYNEVELLDESRTLEEISVQEDDTVFLSKKQVQIKVLTSEGEILFIDVDDHTTVGTVKAKLEDMVKVPVIYQRLFLGKVELQDLSKISDLESHHNSVFYFTAMKEINVSIVTPNGTTKELDVALSTTVKQLQEMLLDSGVHPYYQKLYWDSEMLSEDMTLFESRIPSVSTLYLIEKKTSAIGSIKLKYGDLVTELNVEDITAFKDVKQEIMCNTQKYLGQKLNLITTNLIRLKFPGNAAPNDQKSLKESGIARDCIISVEVDHPDAIRVSRAPEVAKVVQSREKDARASRNRKEVLHAL